MIKVLVPLDGSSAAEVAISHAAAIAHTFSAEIELISVVDNSAQEEALQIDSVAWQLQSRQRQLYLDSLAHSLRKTASQVSTRICDGDPAKVIIQRVDDAKIDLLVLTRFGMGNAQGFSGGGTVQKILSAASAAVLLVDPRLRFDAHRGYQNIVVAVDGGQRSEWATSFAAMLAQRFDGSINLLQIIEPPALPDDGPIDDATQKILDQFERTARSQVNFRLSNLIARMSDTVKTSSRIVVSHDIAATIEATANEAESDLLVLTAQTEHINTAGRYGPICESLLAHMRRPLLVLRAEPAELAMSHYQSVYLEESRDETG